LIIRDFGKNFAILASELHLDTHSSRVPNVALQPRRAMSTESMPPAPSAASAC
jgi:hypothetical protein